MQQKIVVVYFFPTPLYLAQGFKMERTMMTAIISRRIIAIIMHFLDFFCRLFALRRASVPVTTWFTAF
jgi:hypothetical protein